MYFMRRFLSFFACLAVAAFMAAEIPNGYYDGISGLKDSALKTKLHEIIENHSKNSYSGLFAESFCYTDVRSDGTWWDMYSDTRRYVRNGWSGMNREHSLPKSWWGGSTASPAYTDLNHLYPSDGDANMKKSNYPLGEVDDNSDMYDNGVVKVGPPVQGQGGGSTRVFEPADEYKGDFARTYFYMVTCYQDIGWKYTYMTQNTAYPSLQGWAIDLLLKWHREDPVSQKEIDRNDEVYRLQSNRNPYIDFPDLAEYVWGEMKGQPFEDGELPPIGEGSLVSPVNGSTVDFGDIVVGKTKSVTISIRGSLTKNLLLSLSGNGRDDFSIPVTTVPWAEVNENGYRLTVSYHPDAVGDSEAKLLLYDGGLQGITSYVVNLKGSAHEQPVFAPITATAASEITSTGFRANWLAPSSPDVVDYYIVNIYETVAGKEMIRSISTDGAETYYYFTEAKQGASYAYTVQAVRYETASDESNKIDVDFAGVAAIDGLRQLAIAPIVGGLRFVCDEPHTGVRIVDVSGRVVSVLPEVVDGQSVSLSDGIYIVSSEQCPRPVKFIVHR